MGHLGWPESSLVQSHNYAPIKSTNTLRPHHSCEEYFFNRNSCRIIWTNIIECYDSSASHELSVSLTLCIYALEHSFLTSSFSRLNSTHKFVSFGIRANWM